LHGLACASICRRLNRKRWEIPWSSKHELGRS
jgi:hypothetical protein